MEYVFVFTFAVCVLFSLVVISIFLGSKLTLPKLGIIQADGYLIGYPSILYQVYFWFSYAGVI